jgi:hypothetical protein
MITFNELDSPFQFTQEVVEDIFVALKLKSTVGVGEKRVGARVVEDIEGTFGIDVEALGQQGYDAAFLAP